MATYSWRFHQLAMHLLTHLLQQTFGLGGSKPLAQGIMFRFKLIVQVPESSKGWPKNDVFSYVGSVKL